jgi:hypothetical protein
MATCYLCPPADNRLPDAEMEDHLRLLHPDVWGDGPECWPDGSVVVVDMAPEMSDFDGSAPNETR